jgi:hypothetical protein
VASTLGEKLKDLLKYLSSEVNEALLADVEHSQDLLMELLIAALKSETKDSSILFFRILKNALSEGPDRNREMGKIADKLVRRALELRERFAEAIIHVVSCFFKLLTKKRFKQNLLQIVVPSNELCLSLCNMLFYSACRLWTTTARSHSGPWPCTFEEGSAGRLVMKAIQRSSPNLTNKTSRWRRLLLPCHRRRARRGEPPSSSLSNLRLISSPHQPSRPTCR